MLFSTFSEYLSRIESNSSRIEITKILAELFNKCSADEIDKAAYLLTGKVTPLYEPEKFNLADKTIIKAISFAFNKSAEQITRIFHEKGDMGETVFNIVETRNCSSLQQKQTIVDVYNQLYSLTQISGSGTIDNKIRIISSLLKNLDASDGKYIVRIILDKMRLGFSDATILDAYSWMLKGDKSLKNEIEKKYNIHPDLGLIGRLLKEKNIEGLSKIKIEPGNPILMARCERANSPAEILEHGTKFAIEDKYDGFRLQIHLSKNSKFEARNSKQNNLFENKNIQKEEKQVIIYSRNLENVTEMYPDIVSGVLKKFEKEDSLIIEGEAVGFNPKTGDILPFQETVQRKRKYEIEKMSVSVPLKLIVFEILYLNGKELINEKFEERRKILESITVGAQHVVPLQNIVLSSVSWCQTPLEIEKIFAAATSKNMEGVVAKKADGTYRAGARDWNWIKLKRGFQGQKISDTIDCVVMGYDFGQGKRNTFGIGDFLIGVYNETSGEFETVAKIGTGLTDEEWKTIKTEIDKNVSEKTPKQYRVKKEMNCNAWCLPKIVVEIMADEVTKSGIHTAGIGLALRFPRLVRFRPDKKPTDITTSQDLIKMYQKQ